MAFKAALNEICQKRLWVPIYDVVQVPQSKQQPSPMFRGVLKILDQKNKSLVLKKDTQNPSISKAQCEDDLANQAIQSFKKSTDESPEVLKSQDILDQKMKVMDEEAIKFGRTWSQKVAMMLVGIPFSEQTQIIMCELRQLLIYERFSQICIEFLFDKFQADQGDEDFSGSEDGYKAVIAKFWGKLQHSLNGNCYLKVTQYPYNLIEKGRDHKYLFTEWTPCGQANCTNLKFKILEEMCDGYEHFDIVNEFIEAVNCQRYYQLLPLPFVQHRVFNSYEIFFYTPRPPMPAKLVFRDFDSHNRNKEDEDIYEYLYHTDDPQLHTQTQCFIKLKSYLCDAEEKFVTDIQENQWVRDLTRENVEKNPGPPKPENRGDKVHEVKQEAKAEAKKEAKKEAKRETRREFTEEEKKAYKGKQKVKRAVNMNQKFLAKSVKTMNQPRQLRVNKNSLNTVMKAICAPTTAPPVRFSTAYEEDKTAVCSPYEENDVAWPNDETTVTGALEADENALVKFKDPVRNSIQYDANTNDDTAVYNYLFTTSTVTTPSTDLQVYLNGSELEPDVNFLASTDPNGWQPHGPYLGLGVLNDRKSGVWMGSSDKLNFTFSGITSESSKMDITVYKAVGDQWVKEGTLNDLQDSDSPQFFAATSDAYRMFTLSVSTGWPEFGSLHFSANLTIVGSCFGHKTISQLLDIGKPIGPMRFIGSAAQYTNSTATNFQSGNVIIGQLPAASNWREFMAYKKVGALDPSKIQSYPAKKGIYGFIRPSDPRDFEYNKTYSVYDAFGNRIKLQFQIISPTPFLVIFVKTDADATKQSGKWYCYDQVEFQTTNQAFNIQVPGTDPQTFLDAIAATKKILQFHENPLHLKDIGGAIAKVAKLVMDYGPTVLRGAETISKFLA